MSAVNHNHYVTAQRGGKFMSGDSAAGGNISSELIDTPEYSKHNLSHTIRTTAQCGELYPIDSETMVTGDKFHLSGNLTTMFLPTNKPFLDTFDQTLHTYFCPTRLLDPTWTMFFTGGKDGQYKDCRPNFNYNSVANLYSNIDTITTTTNVSNLDFKKACMDGQMFDLFHLPVPNRTQMDMDSSMPTLWDKFIMIQRIYNDYYRMPELECDLFLDIPETPSEVATNFVTALCDYALTPATSSTSVTLKKVVDKAYEYLQSHDGYFWRFYEWLCKRPTNIHIQSENSWYLYDTSNLGHYMSRPICDAPLDYLDVFGNGGVVDYMMACRYYSSMVECHLQMGDSTVARSASGTSVEKSIPYNQFTSLNANDCLACAVVAFFLSAFKPHSMCYERDKYNVCLPYTQRGVAAKLAANIYAATDISSSGSSVSITGQMVDNYNNGNNEYGNEFGDALTQIYGTGNVSGTATSALQAILTQNDLRNLRADTSFLEKAAKFGYRYDEYIRGIFGVTSDVTRLEKPSYIGGLKSGINATRVTNTAASSVSTTGAVQIGQWSGEAGTNANGNIGSWTAAENGYIMSFYCCKPRLSYRDINDPENHKIVDRTQYFTPDYAYIQEQPFTNSELVAQDCEGFSQYVNGDTAACVTIGNLPRYQEYRQIPSTVHGFLANGNYSDYEAFTCARDMSVFTATDVVTMNHVRPDDSALKRLFQVDPTTTPPLVIELGVGLDATRLVPAFARSL